MKLWFSILIILLVAPCVAQKAINNISSAYKVDSLAQNSTDFNLSKRKKVFLISGISGYSAMATSLYFAWYNQFDQRNFHFFNDWGEWEKMDKVGHVYSAYMQAELIYELSSWAGYDEGQALLLGSLSSIAGQLTIEVMDGFSSGWGFSLTDLGANLVGTGGFYFQEKYWGEQRLRLKMSYYPVSYSRVPIYAESGLYETTLHDRSRALYGDSGAERFLKDYNGQTIWVSANIRSFLPESRWPKWLALAVGYSGHNIYGGFDNQWVINNEIISADTDLFPRSGQFVIALDYDLSQIKARKPFSKSLLKILNIFKWPAPGLLYDKDRGLAFHLIYRN